MKLAATIALGFFTLTLGMCISVGDSNRPDSPMPVRDFLPRGTPPDAEVMIHGFVVFAGVEEQGSLESQRQRATAETFLNLLTAVDNDGENKDVAVTYWLLIEDDLDTHLDAIQARVDADPEVNFSQASVDHLIESYDYARANELLTLVNKHGFRGPILLAWPAYSDAEAEHVLFFDLSRVRPEDIDDAFVAWKRHIVLDPEVWQNGVQLELARLGLRGFINANAEMLLARCDLLLAIATGQSTD
ncbi:MAG: hypothetical protein AAF842_12015 [Planctomycetota bacterium]